MDNVKVSLLKHLDGHVSDDGGHVMLEIEDSTGKSMAVALNGEDLSKTIAFMLGLAEDTVARTAPDLPQELLVHPISVADMAVAPGRAPTEAILAMKLGSLTLSFAVNCTTLVHVCETLRQMTKPIPPAAEN